MRIVQRLKTNLNRLNCFKGRQNRQSATPEFISGRGSDTNSVTVAVPTPTVAVINREFYKEHSGVLDDIFDFIILNEVQDGNHILLDNVPATINIGDFIIREKDDIIEEMKARRNKIEESAAKALKKKKSAKNKLLQSIEKINLLNWSDDKTQQEENQQYVACNKSLLFEILNSRTKSDFDKHKKEVRIKLVARYYDKYEPNVASAARTIQKTFRGFKGKATNIENDVDNQSSATKKTSNGSKKQEQVLLQVPKTILLQQGSNISDISQHFDTEQISI